MDNKNRADLLLVEENKEEEELEEEGEASSSFSYNGAETADNLSVEEEK